MRLPETVAKLMDYNHNHYRPNPVRQRHFNRHLHRRHTDNMARTSTNKEQHMTNIKTDITPEILVLAARKLKISEAIVELNAVFLKAFGLDDYHINCGDCEYYADCLAQIVADCEGHWGDELCSDTDDPDVYSYHHITEHQGKYYDSQTPLGVFDFRDISAFRI